MEYILTYFLKRRKEVPKADSNSRFFDIKTHILPTISSCHNILSIIDLTVWSSRLLLTTTDLSFSKFPHLLESLSISVQLDFFLFHCIYRHHNRGIRIDIFTLHNCLKIREKNNLLIHM